MTNPPAIAAVITIVGAKNDTVLNYNEQADRADSADGEGWLAEATASAALEFRCGRGNYFETGSSKQVRGTGAAGLRIGPVSPGGEPSRRPANFRGISQVAMRRWYNLADFGESRPGRAFGNGREAITKRHFVSGVPGWALMNF